MSWQPASSATATLLHSSRTLLLCWSWQPIVLLLCGAAWPGLHHCSPRPAAAPACHTPRAMLGRSVGPRVVCVYTGRLRSTTIILTYCNRIVSAAAAAAAAARRRAGRRRPSSSAAARAAGVGEDLVHHRRHLVGRRHLAPFLHLHARRTTSPRLAARAWGSRMHARRGADSEDKGEEDSAEKKS